VTVLVIKRMLVPVTVVETVVVTDSTMRGTVMIEVMLVTVVSGTVKMDVISSIEVTGMIEVIDSIELTGRMPICVNYNCLTYIIKGYEKH
jgi:hypothetical protein